VKLQVKHNLFWYFFPGLAESVDGAVDECSADLQHAIVVVHTTADVGDRRPLLDARCSVLQVRSPHDLGDNQTARLIDIKYHLIQHCRNVCRVASESEVWCEWKIYTNGYQMLQIFLCNKFSAPNYPQQCTKLHCQDPGTDHLLVYEYRGKGK